MTRERWEQVEELYHLAAERTPGERRRFLCGVCSDEELRSDVETLLTETPAARFLDVPAWEAGASLLIGDAARFAEGAVLAGRYRIEAPIGQGGMGEVYRALDLTLAQTVALKFLPESLSEDPRALNRLYLEVRLARQISHPNVCRVYDIAEADGLRFLTMEFVDGEDLRSHLRRYAPLPVERATVIARRICAGLAAAHERGVLHRDLKPANIMIDAQGDVRITDFGLAISGNEGAPSDIRSGTPAYMAPEQLAGEDVSERSDLYSLGLVLYEVFGGQPLFQECSRAELLRRKSEGGAPPLPHDLNVPPEVEQVVARCLYPDPKSRPVSASAVAAALGAGDALSVAVAAGEMPAPELVELSGSRRGLTLWPAMACLAAVFASLPIVARVGARVNILAEERLDTPSEIERATREKLKGLGIDVDGMHRLAGFAYDIEAIRRHFDAAGLYYWAYASADPILPREPAAIVIPYDPPMTQPPDLSTKWDRSGRLLYLQTEVPPARPPQGEVWSSLFAAAGLHMEDFRPEEPRWIRSPGWDARAAWTGVYPDAQRTPVRIEAAAWRSRPVYFAIQPAWRREALRDGPQRNRAPQMVAVLLTFAISALFVRRNARKGIGDRRGAFRLALVIFAALMTRWVFREIHVWGPMEFISLGAALSSALWYAFGYWTVYMSLEPFVRRRWPHALISWTRVLAGRIRDPLVGADLLMGVAAGSAVTALVVAGVPAIGYPHTYRLPYLLALSSPKGVVAQWVGCALDALMRVLFLFFLTYFAKYFCRKDWLSAMAVIAGFTAATFAVDIPINPLPPGGVIAINGLIGGTATWLLLRRGLLPAVAAGFAAMILFTAPVRQSLSQPGAIGSLFLLAGIAALALFGFHSTLSRREL